MPNAGNVTSEKREKTRNLCQMRENVTVGKRGKSYADCFWFYTWLAWKKTSLRWLVKACYTSWCDQKMEIQINTITLSVEEN